MQEFGNTKKYGGMLTTMPNAMAIIKGSYEYPRLSGSASLYQLADGVLIAVSVSGLPFEGGSCGCGVFGFHIHEGELCEGEPDKPFSRAGGHLNPDGCAHPRHAGDMPPLFACRGKAWQAFVTDRVSLGEILGHTMIIHLNPDDFTTQPSGNSGKMIACGRISHFWGRL